MATIDGNNLYIPSEILREIFSYAPEHRENMFEVLDELLYTVNSTWCDNEYCEKEIDKLDAITSVMSNREYYFCNEGCCSYGMWSIRYDMRKAVRRQMYNSIHN